MREVTLDPIYNETDQNDMTDMPDMDQVAEKDNQEGLPAFLGDTLPSESAFFTEQPEQSPPEKVVEVDKNLKVPQFLMGNRQTRSTDSNRKIHLSLKYKYPKFSKKKN